MTSRSIKSLVAIIGIMLGSTFSGCHVASAQDEGGSLDNGAEPLSKPVNTNNIDMSVPESPAFTALGLTPQEVIHPSSPRNLAVGLLNGVDANGNLQTGLALDVAPYMLAYGNELTLQRYRDGDISLERILARTQLSLATAKGNNDKDEAVRLALGLRLTPFDRGDPRLDTGLTDCFRDAKTLQDQMVVDLGDKILDEQEKLQDSEIAIEELEENERSIAEEGTATLSQDEISEREGQILSEIEKQEIIVSIVELKVSLREKTILIGQTKSCRDKARKRNWNASSWSLGVAPSWISTNGNVNGLELNSVAFWTSVSYGFEESLWDIMGLGDNSQILASARFVPEEKVPDPNNEGLFIEQDTYVAALQVRISVYRKDDVPVLILSFEADYIHADRKGGLKDDTTYRLSVGADYKIPDTKDTYLKFTIGGESGGDEDNEGFVLGSLKVGF